MRRIQCTPQEYANMRIIFGECSTNAIVAAALYSKRCLTARHPDYCVFIKSPRLLLRRKNVNHKKRRLFKSTQSPRLGISKPPSYTGRSIAVLIKNKLLDGDTKRKNN